MLRPLVRSDVRLELDAPDDTAPVRVDVEELEIALTNLVANARDALPHRGTIRIEALNRGDRDALRGSVELSVWDNGAGMAPAIVERVFEPFFTTKGPDQGTGLGLSQVYAFARSAGGSASIDSAVGAGTQVTLQLPAADSHVVAQDVRSRAEASTHTPSKGRTILVVDDNLDVRDSTTMLLEHAGHVVRPAASAAEALAILAEGSRPFAIISDIVMPGEMDGVALAREVRARFPEIRIILATGYSSAADLARSDGLTVLQKPYGMPALLQALSA